MQITPDITIADWEISESFMRASGPGGDGRKKAPL
jgi:protein subunit release factor B